MAQNPKVLEVVLSRSEGAVTRVLTVAEVGGPGFDDAGGKYAIVHTGLVVGEKAVKRAYSLIPCGGGRAELAVKRIGLGASALHDALPGARFGFSGPWGKLIPEGGFAPATLVVSTDTGITTALGLATRRARDAAMPAFAVLWLRAPGEAFLSPALVRERLESSGVCLRIATIPESGAPGRLDAALPHVEALALEGAATHVIGAGDGAIVSPLRTALPGRVGSVEDVRIECFFNNPEKKSA
jgi:ferredoxin-NADP reductase